MTDIVIRKLLPDNASEELARKLNALVKEYSPKAEDLDKPGLYLIARTSRFFYASVGRKVIGMITLAVMHEPMGTIAQIRSPFVTAEYSKEETFSKLIEAAVEEAEKLGADAVEMNVNPHYRDQHGILRKLEFASHSKNFFVRSL